ncbi:MAG: SurA N-terminal domain-containing protein [Bacteroidia bacterium]|nr:SurA N-terminal domain-containing protein [Bacteroidia bacterium]
MAILTKIRNRSGLAIGAVGLALGLFVVSDALNSSSGMFGNGNRTNNVGVIDGESIGIKQFEDKLDYNTANFKKRTQQENLDEATRGQVREQTWNQMLQDYMMSKEYKDLGISMSEDELADVLYGNNVHPQIKQSFTDPANGQFDVNNVKRYLKGLDQKNEAERTQWKDFEDYIVTETLQKKYASLLKKGVYVTTFEAKKVYLARNKSAELNFVALAYTTIADSSIKTDDGDLKSYFKKNMDKYKERENSRKLEFVVWDFAPTSDDSAVVKKWAMDQLEQFRVTDNDTAYVDLNGDTKFDAVAKPRSAYPEEVQARLFSDSVGTVIGPVFKDGKYKIYKISGIKQDTTYNMRASHILLKVEGSTNADTAAAKKKATDILTRIKGGEDFSMLAMQFGTDGTKDKGGDLGWFAEGQMVKEFNDAIKNGKKGDQFVLKTQFGFHVIKITEDKTKKQVTAGILERAIEASEKTSSIAYNEASQFASTSQNVEDFNKNCEEKKITKRVAEFVRETDNFLPGYNEAREAVRWAFNAKVGDVSEVINVGNDKYVIATLTTIREKGKANFDAAKERVITDYRKDKKGEQLMDKLKTAMEGNTTLDAVSRKINQAVTPVASQTFENPSIPYVGFDPIFAGMVAGTTATNKLLGPVKGDAAVYAYLVTKISNGPETKEYGPQKAELTGALQQKLEYGYFEVLKEIRNVKDNRYMFY